MKKSKTKSLYEVLGISPSATSNAIRCAYLQKAKELHPDKVRSKFNPDKEFNNNNSNNSEIDEEHAGCDSSAFLDVKAAYDILSNPEKKFIYDNRFDCQFESFYASINKSVDEHLSFADVSNLYQQLMSFVALASYIIDSRKRSKNQSKEDEYKEKNKNETVEEEQDHVEIDEKLDGYDQTSIPPIIVPIKATLRDFFYQATKLVMVTTSKLDLQTQTETFDIPLMIDKMTLEYPGRGDEFISNRQVARGSVVFDIHVEEDPEIHHYTLFTNHDLMVEVGINIYDYVFGKSFSIIVFDEKVKIRYKGGKPTTIIVENKGLPYENGEGITRGRCFVCLDLSLPNKFETLNSIRTDPHDPNHSEIKMFKILCKKYLL